MRIGNLAGRLVVLVAADRVVDVATASGGRFGADPQAVFGCWDEFCEWVDSTPLGAGEAFDENDLGAPVPAPRQIFAIGMNYRDHADEVGVGASEHLSVFTKFVSSITGPYVSVEHPGGDVDWEVELVVAIGRRAYRVSENEAWEHVAGITGGLDLSERIIQHAGPVPQFSLGKSFPGFGPTGPWLVTPGELADPDDLELGCRVNGEEMQHGSTSQMIFSVAKLVSRLSGVTPLLPGDIIFTGTPAGVGLARTPARYLAIGDEVVSYVSGIGEIRAAIVASSPGA